MLHLTEIKCIDAFGSTVYIYTNTRNALRNIQQIEKNTHISDGLRIMIEENELTPISFTGNLSPWTYFYRKYIKADNSFTFGYRFNWEKELKKYLKKA